MCKCGRRHHKRDSVKAIRNWRTILVKAWRIRFKQRCWAYLGAHLKTLDDTLRNRLISIYQLHR